MARLFADGVGPICRFGTIFYIVQLSLKIDISWRNDLNSPTCWRFYHFGDSLSFSCSGKCLQESRLIGRDLLSDTHTGLLERSDLQFTLS